MGYLVDTSQTLSYAQTANLIGFIKKHGIIQFLHLLKKFKDFHQDNIKWGDEVEQHLLHIDPTTKLPKLQLNASYIFSECTSKDFEIQPEYGSWMLETVPANPYEGNGDPNVPLQNFRTRRREISSKCKEGDVLFAGCVFPLMKVGEYFVPKVTDHCTEPEKYVQPDEEKDNSAQTSDTSSFNSFRDELLNPHPRYPTLCENIRIRRQEKLKMLVPIYLDEKTSMQKTADEPYPGNIHMDETLFGTGNTSIQVTFGTRNLDDARYLTDQLSVFSSIMLPLSASCAIFKGKLADVDVRWNLLGDSVDCRTPEERDPNHPEFLPKTRWSTISRYISNRPQCKEEYNDVEYPLSQEIMTFAREQAQELAVDLDEPLVKHLGFLFTQDPLIIFSDKIYVDDSKNTNHFENIQSTNWNNVRFKPPPNFESDIGWRVELRTVEAQLTAEECTAFAMFSYFVAEMIVKKELNFYIPISKVDENIQRAHKRDAILTQKFWFRKNLHKDSPDDWEEMSIDEILHGKEDGFKGLFSHVYEFIQEESGVDIQQEWERKKQNSEIQVDKVVENMQYFEILSKRATGESPTISHWMRNFVLKHPKYQKDSIVLPEIASDLVLAMLAISDGHKKYQDFM